MRLAREVERRLGALAIPTSLLELRSLPAEDLVHAHTGSDAIATALERVAAARGVVIATPIYKAAYSGLTKAFLDLLPQYGLRDKVVLPLATGGSTAHVLAIDYALRPVLQSMDPARIVGGLFVLDELLHADTDGRLELEAELASRLDTTLVAFASALEPRPPAS